MDKIGLALLLLVLAAVAGLAALILATEPALNTTRQAFLVLVFVAVTCMVSLLARLRARPDAPGLPSPSVWRQLARGARVAAATVALLWLQSRRELSFVSAAVVLGLYVLLEVLVWPRRSA